MAQDPAQLIDVNLVEELARREQQIEQLRNAYIELQQQHQQQRQPQRQTADQHRMDRLFKSINQLPIFTGQGDVTVNSFFCSTEYLLSTINDEELKKEAVRTIFYKTVQGEAKNVIINIPQPDNWGMIKDTLKMRFKPDTEPHEIYRKVTNLRVNTIIMMIILMTQWASKSYCEIVVTKIKDQSGFTDIQFKTQEIVKDTEIILHMINITRIEDILNKMTDNVVLTKAKYKDLLLLEIAKTEKQTTQTRADKCRRYLIKMDICYDGRRG
ncbi:uncharacterized protein [Eurosta solidaginis]|uniref:uncharacterized protein n=1 Tax=Eurosta solidaginis TaxID=178769 RepID=UPI003530E7C5